MRRRDFLMTQIACNFSEDNQSARRDPTYWSRRREWWRAEAKRCGCDWAGINRSQIEVADFLAGLRKRALA
jgi:hypothetical protein